MTQLNKPLFGRKVSLHANVTPEQFQTATAAAKEHGLSRQEYIGALIDKAAGLPSKLDQGAESEQLPISSTS